MPDDINNIEPIAYELQIDTTEARGAVNQLNEMLNASMGNLGASLSQPWSEGQKAITSYVNEALKAGQSTEQATKGLAASLTSLRAQGTSPQDLVAQTQQYNTLIPAIKAVSDQAANYLNRLRDIKTSLTEITESQIGMKPINAQASFGSQEAALRNSVGRLTNQLAGFAKEFDMTVGQMLGTVIGEQAGITGKAIDGLEARLTRFYSLEKSEAKALEAVLRSSVGTALTAMSRPELASGGQTPDYLVKIGKELAQRKLAERSGLSSVADSMPAIIKVINEATTSNTDQSAASIAELRSQLKGVNSEYELMLQRAGDLGTREVRLLELAEKEAALKKRQELTYSASTGALANIESNPQRLEWQKQQRLAQTALARDVPARDALTAEGNTDSEAFRSLNGQIKANEERVLRLGVALNTFYVDVDQTLLATENFEREFSNLVSMFNGAALKAGISPQYQSLESSAVTKQRKDLFAETVEKPWAARTPVDAQVNTSLLDVLRQYGNQIPEELKKAGAGIILWTNRSKDQEEATMRNLGQYADIFSKRVFGGGDKQGALTQSGTVIDNNSLERQMAISNAKAKGLQIATVEVQFGNIIAAAQEDQLQTLAMLAAIDKERNAIQSQYAEKLALIDQLTSQQAAADKTVVEQNQLLTMLAEDRAKLEAQAPRKLEDVDAELAAVKEKAAAEGAILDSLVAQQAVAREVNQAEAAATIELSKAQDDQTRLTAALEKAKGPADEVRKIFSKLDSEIADAMSRIAGLSATLGDKTDPRNPGKMGARAELQVQNLRLEELREDRSKYSTPADLIKNKVIKEEADLQTLVEIATSRTANAEGDLAEARQRSSALLKTERELNSERNATAAVYEASLNRQVELESERQAATPEAEEKRLAALKAIEAEELRINEVKKVAVLAANTLEGLGPEQAADLGKQRIAAANVTSYRAQGKELEQKLKEAVTPAATLEEVLTNVALHFPVILQYATAFGSEFTDALDSAQRLQAVMSTPPEQMEKILKSQNAELKSMRAVAAELMLLMDAEGNLIKRPAIATSAVGSAMKMIPPQGGNGITPSQMIADTGELRKYITTFNQAIDLRERLVSGMVSMNSELQIQLAGETEQRKILTDQLEMAERIKAEAQQVIGQKESGIKIDDSAVNAAKQMVRMKEDEISRIKTTLALTGQQSALIQAQLNMYAEGVGFQISGHTARPAEGTVAYQRSIIGTMAAAYGGKQESMLSAMGFQGLNPAQQQAASFGQSSEEAVAIALKGAQKAAASIQSLEYELDVVAGVGDKAARDLSTTIITHLDQAANTVAQDFGGEFDILIKKAGPLVQQAFGGAFSGKLMADVKAIDWSKHQGTDQALTAQDELNTVQGPRGESAQVLRDYAAGTAKLDTMMNGVAREYLFQLEAYMKAAEYLKLGGDERMSGAIMLTKAYGAGVSGQMETMPKTYSLGQKIGTDAAGNELLASEEDVKRSLKDFYDWVATQVVRIPRMANEDWNKGRQVAFSEFQQALQSSQVLIADRMLASGKGSRLAAQTLGTPETYVPSLDQATASARERMASEGGAVEDAVRLEVEAMNEMLSKQAAYYIQIAQTLQLEGKKAGYKDVSRLTSLDIGMSSRVPVAPEQQHDAREDAAKVQGDIMSRGITIQTAQANRKLESAQLVDAEALSRIAAIDAIKEKVATVSIETSKENLATLEEATLAAKESVEKTKQSVSQKTVELAVGKSRLELLEAELKAIASRIRQQSEIAAQMEYAAKSGGQTKQVAEKMGQSAQGASNAARDEYVKTGKEIELQREEVIKLNGELERLKDLTKLASDEEKRLADTSKLVSNALKSQGDEVKVEANKSLLARTESARTVYTDQYLTPNLVRDPGTTYATSLELAQISQGQLQLKINESKLAVSTGLLKVNAEDTAELRDAYNWEVARLKLLNEMKDVLGQQISFLRQAAAQELANTKAQEAGLELALKGEASAAVAQAKAARQNAATAPVGLADLGVLSASQSRYQVYSQMDPKQVATTDAIRSEINSLEELLSLRNTDAKLLQEGIAAAKAKAAAEQNPALKSLLEENVNFLIAQNAEIQKSIELYTVFRNDYAKLAAVTLEVQKVESAAAAEKLRVSKLLEDAQAREIMKSAKAAQAREAESVSALTSMKARVDAAKKAADAESEAAAKVAEREAEAASRKAMSAEEQLAASMAQDVLNKQKADLAKAAIVAPTVYYGGLRSAIATPGDSEAAKITSAQVQEQAVAQEKVVSAAEQNLATLKAEAVAQGQVTGEMQLSLVTATRALAIERARLTELKYLASTSKEMVTERAKGESKAASDQASANRANLQALQQQFAIERNKNSQAGVAGRQAGVSNAEADALVVRTRELSKQIQADQAAGVAITKHHDAAVTLSEQLTMQIPQLQQRAVMLGLTAAAEERSAATARSVAGAQYAKAMESGSQADIALAEAAMNSATTLEKQASSMKEAAGQAAAYASTMANAAKEASNSAKVTAPGPQASGQNFFQKMFYNKDMFKMAFSMFASDIAFAAMNGVTTGIQSALTEAANLQRGGLALDIAVRASQGEKGGPAQFGTVKEWRDLAAAIADTYGVMSQGEANDALALMVDLTRQMGLTKDETTRLAKAAGQLDLTDPAHNMQQTAEAVARAVSGQNRNLTEMGVRYTEIDRNAAARIQYNGRIYSELSRQEKVYVDMSIVLSLINAKSADTGALAESSATRIEAAQKRTLTSLGNAAAQWQNYLAIGYEAAEEMAKKFEESSVAANKLLALPELQRIRSEIAELVEQRKQLAAPVSIPMSLADYDTRKAAILSPLEGTIKDLVEGSALLYAKKSTEGFYGMTTMEKLSGAALQSFTDPAALASPEVSAALQQLIELEIEWSLSYKAMGDTYSDVGVHAAGSLDGIDARIKGLIKQGKALGDPMTGLEDILVTTANKGVTAFDYWGMAEEDFGALIDGLNVKFGDLRDQRLDKIAETNATALVKEKDAVKQLTDAIGTWHTARGNMGQPVQETDWHPAGTALIRPEDFGTGDPLKGTEALQERVIQLRSTLGPMSNELIKSILDPFKQGGQAGADLIDAWISDWDTYTRDQQQAIADAAAEETTSKVKHQADLDKLNADHLLDESHALEDYNTEKARNQQDYDIEEAKRYRDHLDALRDINKQYSDDIDEAIRNRDVRAMEKAQKKRDDDTNKENEKYKKDHTDAASAFGIAVQRKEEDYAKEQRRRDEDFALRLQELEDQGDDEQNLRDDQLRKKLDDLNKNYKQAMTDSLVAYNNTVRQRQYEYEMQLQAINDWKRQETEDLQKWYMQQLKDAAKYVVDYNKLLGNLTASQGTDLMNMLTLSRWSTQMDIDAFYDALKAAMALNASTPVLPTPTPTVTGAPTTGNPGGGGGTYRPRPYAWGGEFLASQPTPFIAGEGWEPELVSVTRMSQLGVRGSGGLVSLQIAVGAEDGFYVRVTDRVMGDLAAVLESV